ncbi:MAG: DUF1592 domain-containing protein [Alphaproteobacteria bacterium]|nr:DUF1592 domain-containing protein [Alphaproteobacteria bacterium]
MLRRETGDGQFCPGSEDLRRFRAFTCAGAASLALAGATLFAGGLGDPALAKTPKAKPPATVTTAVRRITESQYRHTIADIFGPDIKVNARFEPERRQDGLLAIGSTDLSVTTSGLEQYFALGGSISEQVMDPKSRDTQIGCKPADPGKPDAKCAREFISTVGQKLFRRPLTEGEISARLTTAERGATLAHDFYSGLQLSLTSLLLAPEFLFRTETAEPDPASPGQYRLDAYSKATRLSFLFWDTAPDAELLAAATSGDLQTPAGLNKQVARLAASPRLDDGVRAYFTDMLQFDQFESLNKDAATYPKFSQAVADSAREQTLKTLVDLLIDRKGDYRDIFTSNETFINRYLASIYKVPFASSQEWTRYTFPQSSERSGILTQVTFLSLFSHPGRSSPTRRGIKLHEIFTCQPTPDPPANVDFSKVQAIQNGTVRTRLIDHMTNEGCSICHQSSDPPGLTLEHFDGLGQLRTTENGLPIDVSADIDGVKFSGAQGLGKFMHDDPNVPACLVKQVYGYSIGRAAGYRDQSYIARETEAFAKSGYQVPALLTAMATSPEFFAVKIPAGVKVASQSDTPTSPTR